MQRFRTLIVITIYPYFKVLKDWYDKLFNSQWYNLIPDLHSRFQLIKEIAPASWVKSSLPDVYHVQRNCFADYYMNELALYSIRDAVISYSSDFIMVGEECVWEKSLRSTFSAENPADYPLLLHKDNKVLLRNYRKEVVISGNVISLVGVFSDVWAHFVVMYLPKLYYAGENGLLDGDITLLTPHYKDAHLKEMVDEYLIKYPNVRRVEVNHHCNYRCEALLYIPTLCVLADASDYILPFMGIFTPLVGDLLRKNLIDPFTNKANEIVDDKVCSSKIYITRRYSAYRSILNGKELEDLFVSKGFTLVDPGKMSLLEKVKVFSHADVIAGPLSGGFINTLFCKENAKVLGFSTIPRIAETFLPFIQSLSKFDLLLVTGLDLDKTTQPNYIVSKDRVEDSLNQLLSK